MRRGKWAIVTVGIIVTACGGGGGDGSGSGAVAVIPGATPTPTPTPTPTVTPTPTPTPTPTYPTYAQLAGNQTQQTSCTSLIFGGVSPLPQPATDYGSGLLVNYTAASDNFSITNDGLNLTYGPAERQATASGRSYVRTQNGFTQRFTLGTPTVGGTPMDYAAIMTMLTLRNTFPQQYYCVLGVPTLLTDRPAVSAVSFPRVAIIGGGYVTADRTTVQTYSLTPSVGTVNVNLVTGQVGISIRLVGTLQTASGATTTELGTVTGTAELDETRTTYNAILTSADRRIQSSSLGGWFFGPQGKEAAMTFSLLATDPTSGATMTVAGTLFAQR